MTREAAELALSTAEPIPAAPAAQPEGEDVPPGDCGPCVGTGAVECSDCGGTGHVDGAAAQPDDEAARGAWDAFKAAYIDYQQKNPNWRGHWTDHHAYAFDAALAALRGKQQ